MKHIKTFKIFENINEIIDEKIGNYFWFEYHCYEGVDSSDYHLFIRSHTKVFVIKISENGIGDTSLERAEQGCPRCYTVRFEDGFENTVFEDELYKSKEDFELPDPPSIDQAIKNLEIYKKNPKSLENLKQYKNWKEKN